MRAWIAVLAAGVTAAVVAGSDRQESAAAEAADVNRSDPMRLTMPKDVTPATMIAYAGHGGYYDHLARPIQMDDALVLRIELSMSEQLLRAGAGQLNQGDVKQLIAAQKLAQSGQLNPIRAALLQGAVTSFLLEKANRDLLEQVGWRHRLLMRRYTALFIDPKYADVLFVDYKWLRDKLRDWIVIRPSTGYVQRCRANGVPIPPAWNRSRPNGWVLHGALEQNLLEPGRHAQVWTWSDPGRRGGCIMLPRNDSRTGVAGTICQSATTGRACFWDNRDRVSNTVLGWSGVTLDVNRMQDGDMLAQNCTGCHRGNNVFLISPDDPTWAKVLRPASRSSIGATFTTNVAAGIARYTPISTQPGWANPPGTPCIGCHERPAVGFSAPPMPPACAGGSTSDPSRCYN